MANHNLEVEDTPSAAVDIGELVGGKYRLLTNIATGGMAAVWVAHNEPLDIQVAIKIILARIATLDGGRVADRMLQEARAAAKLIHPAIVRITDYGKTAKGHPYLVMELLNGEDLASAQDRRGRLRPDKAVRMILPIIAGLAYAHEKGVVHRDVKPDNIFLCQTERGVQPKLIDFGVAKLDTKANERLTANGVVMGSPGYMAPEQARGEDADERADIWSTCVVLYEMVTGALPFAGKNYNALLRAIIEEPVEPLATHGVNDPGLWRILERGLAKKPEGRWPCMRDLGVALAEWLMARGIEHDICGAPLVASWHRGAPAPTPADVLDSMPPPGPSQDGDDDDETIARRSIADLDTLPGSSQAGAGDGQREQDRQMRALAPTVRPPSTAKPAAPLGKYRLLAELGRGGMARVYLALTSGPAKFHKLVVIKEIQSDLASEPDIVAMFLDEARLAARLNHPNVVQTNEVGEVDGRYFIAMEYLEGQTMKRVLNKLGRGEAPALTLGMRLRILCDALGGLHHAHELVDFDGTPLGVVHRDVSPHNIFVTYSGQVKVLDFGVAKALNAVTETRPGVLKGKVAFMSPEQARGERVDRRADVYAAGVVLWEMATGQRLFEGIPEVAILQKVLTHDIPRPKEVSPAVDPQLDAIIMKAMARTPDERHSSAAALAAELEEWLREQGDKTSVREIGELVSTCFAADRAKIRSIVEEQIRLIEEAPVSRDVPIVPLFDATASTSGSHPKPAGEQRVSAAWSHSEGLAPRSISAGPLTMPAGFEPRPTTRWPWVVAGAAIATVVVAFLLFRGADASDVAPAISASAATAPSSSAQASHLLRIESRPGGAKVRCNGELIGVTPLEVSVASGERPCAYVLLTDGYEPYSVKQAAMTQDSTLMADLVPEAGPAPEPSASTITRTRGKVAPPPPPSAAPPPPPPPKDDIRLRR